MNGQQFSLAVVRGGSAGTVLRTRRKRISIGSAEENDLVVADPSMSPRHLLVLVDGNRWRVHQMAPNTPIETEERWIHPNTGTRGARITVAGSEILLYPGFLENEVVEQEIASSAFAHGKDRPPPPQTVASSSASTSSPSRKPVGQPVTPSLGGLEWSGEVPGSDPRVGVKALPGDPTQPDGGPTIPTAVPPSVTPIRPTPTVPGGHSPRFGDHGVGLGRGTDPSREAPLGLEVDLVHLSQMETVSGERPPESLIAAAKVRLLDERTPALRQEAPLLGELDIPDTAETVIHRRVWAPHATPKAKGSIVTPPEDPAARGRPRSQVSGMTRGEAIPPPSSDRPPDRLLDRPPRVEDSPPAAGPTAREGVRNGWAQDTAPNPREPWSVDAARTRPMAIVPTRSPPESRLPSYPAAVHVDDAAGRRAAWGVGQDAHHEDPVRAGHIVSAHDLAKRDDDAALAVIQDPDGAYATRIRLLGTRIDDFVRRLGYRAYMLTSCEPLTGKTTAILNLAFALAEDPHRRVAVIEANFRYPRFAELLGIPPGDGILPVLQGRAELAKAATKIADRNLVIIPSGGTHPHPAEVLASPRFKTLIAELANTVDVALIDAPSIRPFADANLLQPLVDGVVLVVAEASTPGLWLAQAAAQIGEDRVLGTLYNRIPGPIARGLKRERKIRLRQH
ncbi:MAG: hypothetical protein IPK13_13370 [Deltaproteobacteria bacterium]|nr:hypothetical protein [Deltaproteobacteria bacterium]